MKCDDCPAGSRVCLGEQAVRLCALARTRPDYRAFLAGASREENAASFDLSRLLAAVSACPDRGAVLPHSLQAECGCGELTACGAGRGKQAGRVTLADCLRCVSLGGAGRRSGETAAV